MAASKSGSDYFPHQDGARPRDLLKIRRRELREHYDPPPAWNVYDAEEAE